MPTKTLQKKWSQAKHVAPDTWPQGGGLGGSVVIFMCRCVDLEMFSCVDPLMSRYVDV